MRVDYLLIGYGIANVCFAKHCLQSNKSFIIYDDQKITASNVAAGVVNPVVLKRFNPVWNAAEQMTYLKKTFKEFGEILNNQYFYSLPLYRIFANTQEFETWQKKRLENPVLEKYLKEQPLENQYENIIAMYGFGEMRETGYVDITKLLADFKQKYSEHFINDKFEYEKLNPFKKEYQNIEYGKIVFAEGAKVKKNPFFQEIPIVPNKGQVLKIRIEEPLPAAIIKSKCFLMPIGNHEYYVGATYNREFENDEATLQDREKLQQALESFYKGSYQIIDEKVGVRPTVTDRRPIIGEHKQYKNMYILNGLGTRGTFNGPMMAKHLFHYIEDNQPLPKEVDVKRFKLNP